MKELIDKLALGIIEYDLPVLEASVSEIERTLSSEKVYEDSFTVYSSNNIPLKGFVYATNENINIIDKQFVGKSYVIKYSVDTEYINEGDTVKCDINVVSNGGELIIPVKFKVGSASIVSSIGEIKNLFHFANLVQTNYEEALAIFKTPAFTKTLLKDDFYLMAMYDGLKESTSLEIAMEEFLVSANKKKTIGISISDHEKIYDNVTQNEGDTVVITKDSWGYTEIDIISKDDFIKVDKTKITSNDFAGSNYEFKYYIEANRLHGGLNYGVIEFVTKTSKERLEICASSGKAKDEKYEIRRKYQACISSIFEDYIDFRVHRIDMDKWTDSTLDSIERMRAISDDSVFLKLLQAQICITKGMEADASWLLESAAEEIFENRSSDKELYCYYLYVRSIQKRNPDFTKETIEKVKHIYNIECDSWKILWILFYLDESYDNNLSIKLARIKEQFGRGMNSPLMYYEAMSIFIEFPELLRVLDEFELQVLNFGSRQGIITKQLSERIAELTVNIKSFNKLLFSVLAELYDMYGTKSILSSIVGMLIRCNKTEKRYFLWYEEAVNEELKLTSLFEYFMYSMPEDYSRPLPHTVTLYFGYNSGLSDESLAVVYENIIRYKLELESIYMTYHPQMEKFVAKCIDKELIDEHLSCVYEDVLKKVMVTPETAAKLPKILNTYLITCEQENIREIMVIHKEINGVMRYPVVEGRACVQIYTEDAALVFVDFDGVRYGKSVKYSMRRLLHMDEYMDLCLEMSAENDNLILFEADRYLKYRKNPEKSVSVLKYLIGMQNVRDLYKVYVEREIIDYYATNYDFDAVDEYLMSVDGHNLGTKSRIKLIELMIVRGLYEHALEFMKKYGYSIINPGRTLRCVSKLIEACEFIDDNIIIDMAAYSFRHGKYNETTLKYLSTYFVGSTKEMYELWTSCCSYDYSNITLEESLIASILFTGSQSSHLGEVYESYQKKGAGEKIRRAYLFAKAYDYFVKEQIVDESVFKYIEKDIALENPIHDICRFAFIKYCSQKEELTERQKEICSDIVFEMCNAGKLFEFYKEFDKYFELPMTVVDKTIVEYHTNPKNRVLIHYMLETGNLKEQNYIIKEMTDICNGIFVQDFVLFYGEEIKYYITEEYKGEHSITESNSIVLEDNTIADKKAVESRYTMLNNMMISYEMHEDNTLSEMVSEYMIMSGLGDKIFKVK